jgi:Domain of unknown function (DUF6471)
VGAKRFIDRHVTPGAKRPPAPSEASITMKLKRGTFAATFFLACLAALELEGVNLADI